MRILIAGASTFLLAMVLTLIVRRASASKGLLAAPRHDRWHQKPTPVLGGVAIYFAFIVGYLIFAPKGTNTVVILAASTLLFLTGLVDDIVHIKPYAKLVIQIIAAGTLVFSGIHLPWADYMWVNDVLTMFWLVGITNAINLLDNMDGLAAGITTISSSFLVITFLINGQTSEAVLPAVVGGAALGFLVFNYNPASIFMGDSGSMFLGFMLAGTSLLADKARFRSLTSVLLTPVLILMIPIFDTCFVTVSRKLSGRRVSQGGKDHTSHRLVALGVSERRAVVVLYLFAALSGIFALAVRWLETTVVLALAPLFGMVLVSLGLYLGKVRVYEEGEQPDWFRHIKALADFSYKRRVFEVLGDAVLIALAYYGAYVLRWDGHMSDEQLGIFLKTLPLVIIIQLSIFLAGGVYRGLWRYAGINDFLVIAKAAFVGWVTSMIVVFGMYRFSGPSRAVALGNLLLLLFFACLSRLSFHLLRAVIVGRPRTDPDATRILIYGAGDGGELLIREILSNPSHRYAPVGFIDDDSHKAGKNIHGFRIFSSSQAPVLIREYGVAEVLISSVKVPDARLDQLRGLGVSLKKMRIRIESADLPQTGD